jgi:hypothetical protein
MDEITDTFFPVEAEAFLIIARNCGGFFIFMPREK